MTTGPPGPAGARARRTAGIRRSPASTARAHPPGIGTAPGRREGAGRHRAARRVRGCSRVDAGPQHRPADQHIRRFDVQVQHPGPVHRVQPVGDLPQQHQHPPDGQRLPGQLVRQIGALDVRHHQVGPPAIVTGVDDGQHAGMVDCRGHPALLVELATEIGIGGTARRGRP